VALPDLVAPPEVLADRVRFRQTCGGHTGVPVPRSVPNAPFVRVSAPLAWTTIVLTLRADGTSTSEIGDASLFPRHYLYDTNRMLTHKSALIRYKEWLHRSELKDSPWEGVRQAIPMARVKAEAERSLADTILVSAHYHQHRMPEEAMLSSVTIRDDQVAVLLDGLLMVLIDDEPAVELGPGAILDPSERSEQSKQHAKIRAQTAVRLAVMSRDQLDDHALHDVASEQTTALDALLAQRQTAEQEDQ
jgi:hypothetical protein